MLLACAETYDELGDPDLAYLTEAVPPSVRQALAAGRQAARAQIVRTLAAVAAAIGAVAVPIGAELVATGTDMATLSRATDSLLRLVNSQTSALDRSLKELLAQAQDDATLLAVDLVDEPLRVGGAELFLTEPTLPLLQTLKDSSADLITGITTDVRTRINQEIRLLTLGSRSVEGAMANIERLLPPPDKRLRTGAAARSEAIVRTEVGRVQSAATDHRLTQAARSLPGLRKQWIHSGNAINPRSGHQAYSGTHVPVDEPFLVAPLIGATREALRYPRDPLASARSTVNCRCVATGYMPEWDS